VCSWPNGKNIGQQNNMVRQEPKIYIHVLISQIFIAVLKYLRNQFILSFSFHFIIFTFTYMYIQCLLWLIVSEVSIHDQLAPLLWTCDEAECHGGRTKLLSLQQPGSRDIGSSTKQVLSFLDILNPPTELLFPTSPHLQITNSG
jgi:hypothetical protein